MAKNGPRIEVHQNPVAFNFKKATDGESVLKLMHEVNLYLQAGGDARLLHHQHSELMLSTNVLVSTKVIDLGTEVQGTNLKLDLPKPKAGKEEKDEQVAE